MIRLASASALALALMTPAAAASAVRGLSPVEVAFFDLDAKRAALARGAQINPFIDPAGCRAQLTWAEAAFRKQLAQERAEAGR